MPRDLKTLNLYFYIAIGLSIISMLLSSLAIAANYSPELKQWLRLKLGQTESKHQSQSLLIASDVHQEFAQRQYTGNHSQCEQRKILKPYKLGFLFLLSAGLFILMLEFLYRLVYESVHWGKSLFNLFAASFCFVGFSAFAVRKLVDVFLYSSFRGEGYVEIGLLTIFVIIASIYCFVYKPNAAHNPRRTKTEKV